MNRYYELKQKQQEEVDNFPMKFAFSDDQFKKGMQELGLTENDTDKVYSIPGGGFIRKSDSKSFNNMFKRHEQEMGSAINNDKDGTGFIKEMFGYELDNHEYCITYDLKPTLDALDLTMDKVNQSENLLQGLKLARKEYLESNDMY